MQNSDRNKKIKSILNSFSNPAAVMDEQFKCVFTNRPKLIPLDLNMLDLFQKTICLPIKSPKITMGMINGSFYGVRIVPYEEDIYICEFFDKELLFDLMENANVLNDALPIVHSVSYNTSALWRCYSNLCSKLESEKCYQFYNCASEMNKYLTALLSVSQNINEYTHMMSDDCKDLSVINIVPLLKGMVERCNSLIKKSDRYIDVYFETYSMYIRSQVRYVVCAVTNALQNALMYSPRECIPHLFAYLDKQNSDVWYLEIVNDGIAEVDHQSDKQLSLNFPHQRLGFGIPIIKRFAELAGGEVTFKDNGCDEKIRLIIKLPLIHTDSEKKASETVKSSRYVFYKTDIPDIIDIKMAEINHIFGK